MTIEDIKVTGGKMRFDKMTKKRFEEDELSYGLARVHQWLGMLNDGMRPTKWHKPTSKGTSVTFEYIYTEEEFFKGADEMKVLVNELNRKYDADIAIEFNRKGEKNND